MISNEERKRRRKEYEAINREAVLRSKRKYYHSHKEKIKEQRKTNMETPKVNAKNYRAKRVAFLDMYGGKCACCGESIEEFLTIEHIHGQRGQKRVSPYKAYKTAVENYDPTTYEILCMNCNHAKGRYGYCPHQNVIGL